MNRVLHRPIGHCQGNSTPPKGLEAVAPIPIIVPPMLMSLRGASDIKDLTEAVSATASRMACVVATLLHSSITAETASIGEYA